MGTKARAERWMKLWSAAGGTRKEGVILLSMVLPCLVKKVEDWASTTAYSKQVTRLGAI
ncbi:unnamed protein product [Spirodela intermedia]|uniref:Uncharacterized protein n=1 Tax=Spirodela intermedia TaxID=51605 RepID=A0ABN7E909_SPIIN|nr:unnamed protein product [Spirodela intermedia]